MRGSVAKRGTSWGYVVDLGADDVEGRPVKAQFWENPRTGQIRLFDLSKPYYRESPVPRDRSELVACGPWRPHAG